MILTGHTKRLRALGWLGLAVVLAGAMPAEAQEALRAAAGTPPPATVVLVYVAWQELEGDLLDAAELRRVASTRLADLVRAQGGTVAPAAAVEPLVVRWRIRSGQMIHDEFLADLHRRAAGGRLLVGELYLLSDRLVVAWRMTDTGSGLLTGAGFAGAALALEEPAEDSVARGRGPARDAERVGTGPWLEAARRLQLELPLTKPAAQGPTAPLVLPLQAVGSENGAAALATHALLVDLLQAGEGAVPDPSLVATAIRRAGWRTDEMNAGVRALLRERFGATAAWTGLLVAYDISASRPTPAIGEGELPRLTSGSAVEDFALGLTLVDLADGRITVSRELFENRAVDEGWFGLQTRHPLLQRLRSGVALLLRDETD